jgi:rhodanese-related sulfurtransferase
MAGGVRIWLLGGFRVEVEGRAVAPDHWRRSRLRQLIALLALSPAHRRASITCSRYCAGGCRSSGAASLLTAAGFRNVFDLLGGYQAWRERDEDLLAG